jgi:hypothetical protein
MDFSNEQMFHDLEQRHISLRKDYSNVIIERDMIQGISFSFCFSWLSANCVPI